MPHAWSQIAPILARAAEAVLALVALSLIGLGVSPFLMRSHANRGTRDLGCFLYAAGLWVLVRFVIGALGAILGAGVYLWEHGKDIDAIKRPTDELQQKISVGWLLVFVASIGLLEIIGDKLRKLSEKHHEIARGGFRKLFRAKVSSELPELNNTSDVVLAYRAVWADSFGIPNQKNIDGWRFGDLCERVRLIHFSPTVRAIHPRAGTVGAAVNIAGSGFTQAEAVHFGSVPATDMRVNSDASITATAPPGHGLVPLTVSSRAGVPSAPSGASTFTYTIVGL